MSGTAGYANVLGNMLGYEQKLHLIYNMLAKKFSELKVFWEDIAADENTHALMLESLIVSHAENNPSYALDRSFSLSDIEHNLIRADDFLGRLQGDDVSLEYAFGFAMEAESSLIEREMFSCHENDPDDLKRIFKVLHDQSADHYAKIKENYTRLFGN